MRSLPSPTKLRLNLSPLGVKLKGLSLSPRKN